MIGPRSALFAPFPDLGLIVIDEEHETSYKSEVTPRYHARETAVRAGLEHAHAHGDGSATPSVDASYACETGAYALFRMDARYGNVALPSVWIADMREELQMETVRFCPKTAGRDRKRLEKGTGCTVSEPQRLCGLRLMPCMRPCDEMPALRCITDSTQ